MPGCGLRGTGIPAATGPIRTASSVVVKTRFGAWKPTFKAQASAAVAISSAPPGFARRRSWFSCPRYSRSCGSGFPGSETRMVRNGSRPSRRSGDAESAVVRHRRFGLRRSQIQRVDRRPDRVFQLGHESGLCGRCRHRSVIEGSWTVKFECLFVEPRGTDAIFRPPCLASGCRSRPW
jgi:hypothetical protein